MENKSFNGKDESVELKKITINGNNTSTPKSTTTCTPAICRTARGVIQPPDESDSPWNIKKTYFLIGIIAMFVVWILIYAIVSKLKIV